MSDGDFQDFPGRPIRHRHGDRWVDMVATDEAIEHGRTASAEVTYRCRECGTTLTRRTPLGTPRFDAGEG